MRKKSIFILILLSACVIPVKKRPLKIISAVRNDISIASHNEADRYALCSFVKKYRITQNGCSVTSHVYGRYVLEAEIELKEESTDTFRNAGLSLLSFGSFIGVSSSGIIKTSLHDPAGEKSLILNEKGRYGLWAFVLPPVGFPATLFAAMLNGYRRPSLMQAECRLELEGKLIPKRSMEACREYSGFIEDALYYKINDIRRFINKNIEFTAEK